MRLREIFSTDIDRPIESVIKADDERNLATEVNEFVLTQETAALLQEFLNYYIENRNIKGAWISGFFGSGKSHFLKILALLLENRVVDGVPVLDLFLPKCGEDGMLAGDLRKACSFKSRSILFNIDQKASLISKDEQGALLAVFVKVFDEMCGYEGQAAYVASFERDLDRRGLYEKFKEEYGKQAGIPWETGREMAFMESHKIQQAFSVVTGQEPDPQKKHSG